MSNILYVNFNKRVTASPLNASYNQVMHLRAHGWSHWTIGGITRWAHPSVMNAGLLDFDSARQAQKAIELGRRYWK